MIAPLIVSALISASSHAPLDLGWAILFGPAIFWRQLIGARAKTAFLSTWLWCFLYGCFLGWPIAYLIKDQTNSWFAAIVGLTLIIGLQALFLAPFGLIAVRMRGILIPIGFAAAWTVVNYLRGLGPTGFVWGHFGVALHDLPLLALPIRWMGTWGLEFLIALLNATIALAFWRRRFWPLPFALLALWFGLGLGVRSSLPQPDGSLKVAVCQPNVELNRHFDDSEQDTVRAILFDQIEEAAAKGAQLVIFPESIETDDDAFDIYQSMAERLQITIMLGAPRRTDSGSFGTVFSFMPNYEIDFYDKVRAVPFGEFIPFRPVLGFAESLGAVGGDLLIGAEARPIQSGHRILVGAPLCMESTYPWIAAEMSRRGAQLFALGSNESWFGRTPALDQHAAFAALRAMETGKVWARSAPQAVSGFWHPDGKKAAFSKFVAQVSVQNAPLFNAPTLASRLGDWPVWAMAALLVLLLLRPAVYLPNDVRQP